MQKILTKYWVAINLAFLVAISWLDIYSGKFTAGYETAWMALFAFEACLLLPSLHREEAFPEARGRVLRHLFQDPFFYVGLGLVLMAGIQAMNGGCELKYLPDADIWRYSTPKIEWLPSCVKVADAESALLMFLAVWVTVFIVRNGIGRQSRFLLLRLTSMASGCIGWWGVVGGLLGKEPYYSFAVKPSVAVSCGIFFGFWLLVGWGVMVTSLAHSEHRRALAIFVTAFLGNLLAALYFAPLLPLLALLLLLVVLFVYGIIFLANTDCGAGRIARNSVSALLCLGLAIVGFGWFAKGTPLAARYGELVDIDKQMKTLVETKEVRSHAAMAIWQDAPWTGVGANGFGKYLGMNISQKEWRAVKRDQSCVLNESIQLLCEFGVMGAALFLAGIIALLVPIAYRLRCLWIHSASDTQAGSFFMQVPPYLVSGGLAILFIFVTGFVTSPFRIPGMFCSWFTVFAVASAALPSESRQE